jgi:hypothetical protein
MTTQTFEVYLKEMSRKTYEQLSRAQKVYWTEAYRRECMTFPEFYKQATGKSLADATDKDRSRFYDAWKRRCLNIGTSLSVYFHILTIIPS